MPIQLPDDAIATGYKETRPCYFEQVYFSPSRNFTGTEYDFFDAGLAYMYVQIDKHWRSIFWNWDALGL
jgi:hypothetical protein